MDQSINFVMKSFLPNELAYIGAIFCSAVKYRYRHTESVSLLCHLFQWFRQT